MKPQLHFLYSELNTIALPFYNNLMVIVFALFGLQNLSSPGPQSSIQLALPAVEAESYHWTYREVG